MGSPQLESPCESQESHKDPMRPKVGPVDPALLRDSAENMYKNESARPKDFFHLNETLRDLIGKELARFYSNFTNVFESMSVKYSQVICL